MSHGIDGPAATRLGLCSSLQNTNQTAIVHINSENHHKMHTMGVVHIGKEVNS